MGNGVPTLIFEGSGIVEVPLVSAGHPVEGYPPRLRELVRMRDAGIISQAQLDEALGVIGAPCVPLTHEQLFGEPQKPECVDTSSPILYCPIKNVPCAAWDKWGNGCLADECICINN